MKQILKSDKAFPVSIEYLTNGQTTLEVSEGMSKRFYAACAAMQGVLAGEGYYLILHLVI